MQNKLWQYVIFGLIVSTVSVLVAPLQLRGAEEAREWSIAGAVYSNDVLQVSNMTADTRAVDFSPDGTRVFVLGRATVNVAMYELRIPWVLTSGVQRVSFDLSHEVGQRNQGYVPHGLFLRKPAGDRMYVWNRTEMFEYELKTAWDITTARAIGYKSLRPHVIRGHDIDFAADGRRLYIDDRDQGKVVQFDLQPAWNIESAAFSGALNMAKLQKAMRGIQFSPSGKRLFVLDTWLRQIFEFEVETPWDVKSAKLRDTLQLDKKIRDPRNLVWRPDGRVVYITDTFSGTVRTVVVP